MKRTWGGAVLVLGLLVLSCGVDANAQTTDDLVFIHHSCGSNWLSNSLNAALVAKTYIDERNDITYGTDVAPDSGRPDSLASDPGDSTNMNHWVKWFNDYLGGVKSHGCADGVNKIIMFKSCYPISNMGGDGTEPGDPFVPTPSPTSTQTITNYKAVYRHPSGAGNTYSTGGYNYYALEDIFAANPDTLFIPVTAPPLCNTSTTNANAYRARAFNEWLKNEWQASYNAANPGLNNVAVFDWFDVLASDNDAAYYPNRLKEVYGGGTTDSHPNSTGNADSTVVFATGTDNFIDGAYDAFTAEPVPEPATMTLVGLGLGAVALVHRRRKT